MQEKKDDLNCLQFEVDSLEKEDKRKDKEIVDLIQQ